MNARPCPFCHRDPARVLGEDDLTVTYKDGFPVSPGHTVSIPKRHVATLFEATDEGQPALLKMLNCAKIVLDKAHHQNAGLK
jgi:diadenosine tetraphosphate (Ap4A) HIT family hydrolase